MNRTSPTCEATDLADRIAELRPALRGYVLSLLPHYGACDDVVQETCVFLWERREECGEGTNLRAWAFRVAWFKVMAHRRDRVREKTVIFSEDILHEVAEAAEMLADEAQDRLDALRKCLAGLSPAEIRLLQLKYVEGRSLTDYAMVLGQQPSRIQKTLSRLRLALRHCIETKLAK